MVGALSDVTQRRLSEIELSRARDEATEALAHQTATADVLKVISRSSFDLQVVLDTVVESATRQCGADHAYLFQREGEFFRWAAGFGHGTEVHERIRAYFKDRQVPVDRGSVTGRVALEARVVEIPDVLADREYTWGEVQRIGGYRSALGVPLLREGKVVGVIFLAKTVPQPFTAKQIEVATTFADQAVIAIENARLFNETKEALERQTATAEILKVISSTPTDVQPVFDAIVRNAVTLCDAKFASAFRYDGERLHFLASTSPDEKFVQALKEAYPLRPDRSQISGRTILSKSVERLEDALADPEYRSHIAVAGSWRRMLGVPLLRDGNPIGAIVVGWEQAGPIAPVQEQLLKTFADQAVIAVENVRLFNETKEALELQTATSEVLRVISGTPADPQPVFDAIAQSAARVFDAPHTAVSLVDGGLLRLKATAGRDDPRRPTLIPFDRTSTSGCALLDKVIVDVPDTEAAGAPLFAQDASRAMAFRAIASAPMLREGAAIGAITVARAQPGALSDKRRQLLQTFADQAVIAIENARLFNETKEAFERQKASAEILGTISSSIADTEPVFEKILESCERLFAGRTVGINVLGEDQMIHLGAYRGPGRGAFEKVFPLPIDANSGSGLAIAERRVVHIPDSEADGVPEAARRGNRARGNRASLYAPMISRDKAIGVIWVARELPGAFSETEIALLKTFADQAVIAIDNARLFNETREALEQQTASSQILGVISSSLTDLRPVFDAILESATRLCDAHLGVLNLFEGEMCRTLAQRGGSPEFAKWVLERGAFKPAAAMARVLVERKPFHVPDAREGPGFKAGNENA
ncbi:MAG TPA: GAF domain-containing protein, partial [Burkholderiales bacterium]